MAGRVWVPNENGFAVSELVGTVFVAGAPKVNAPLSLVSALVEGPNVNPVFFSVAVDGVTGVAPNENALAGAEVGLGVSASTGLFGSFVWPNEKADVGPNSGFGDWTTGAAVEAGAGVAGVDGGPTLKAVFD